MNIKKTSRIIFPEVQNYSKLPTTNLIDLVNVAILILFAVIVQEMTAYRGAQIIYSYIREDHLHAYAYYHKHERSEKNVIYSVVLADFLAYDTCKTIHYRSGEEYNVDKIETSASVYVFAVHGYY